MAPVCSWRLLGSGPGSKAIHMRHLPTSDTGPGLVVLVSSRSWQVWSSCKHPAPPNSSHGAAMPFPARALEGETSEVSGAGLSDSVLQWFLWDSKTCISVPVLYGSAPRNVGLDQTGRKRLPRCPCSVGLSSFQAQIRTLWLPSPKESSLFHPCHQRPRGRYSGLWTQHQVYSAKSFTLAPENSVLAQSIVSRVKEDACPFERSCPSTVASVADAVQTVDLIMQRTNQWSQNAGYFDKAMSGEKLENRKSK